jgi:internalin A
VKKLAALKQLQELILDGTKVTDAGVKELAALKQLQTLNLQSTKVTAAGVAALKKALPSCMVDR